MRKLIYGMNLTLDGYVAAPGDDLGWGVQVTNSSSGGWLRNGRSGCCCTAAGSGKPREPTGQLVTNSRCDARTDRVRTELAGYAQGGVLLVDRHCVDWNARLFTGDPIPEITRLKSGEGPPSELVARCSRVRRCGLASSMSTPSSLIPCSWAAEALLLRPGRLGGPGRGGDSNVPGWGRSHAVRDETLMLA